MASWLCLGAMAVLFALWVLLLAYWPSKPKFDPANIPVTKMNAANPILMLYGSNMLSRREVQIVTGLLARRGIQMISVPVFDGNFIQITDLSNLPAVDIDEIRKLIAEKVVV